MRHLGVIRKLQIGIPNALSLFRLLAGPGVGILLYQKQLNAALWLYIAAGVSDLLDGYLARLWNAQSAFGRLCDPLADKMLILISYAMMGYEGLLPPWIVVLVFARDLILIPGATFVILTKKPITLEPTWISRINTVFQIALVGLALIGYLTPLGALFPSFFPWIMLFLTYLTGLTTFWSGAGYVGRFWQQWRGKNDKRRHPK